MDAVALKLSDIQCLKKCLKNLFCMIDLKKSNMIPLPSSILGKVASADNKFHKWIKLKGFSAFSSFIAEIENLRLFDSLARSQLT
jgi:hypothetical protein